ncbi:MAG: Yip1 family protein [Chloroflexota bacterium]|jgi:hypothetical protein
MVERIVGVFKLNRATFKEIEADETATTQAAIIVAIVGLLAGFGAAIGAVIANRAMGNILPQLEDSLGSLAIDIPTLSPIGAFLNGLIGAFLAWILWSALTYFIGTRLFKGDSSFNEMLRLLGFAQAPRLLAVFGFIPCLGGILGLVGWIWSLVASYIAVKEGLDLDDGKTILTVVISFVVVIVINVFVLGPVLALIM